MEYEIKEIQRLDGKPKLVEIEWFPDWIDRLFTGKKHRI